MFSRSKTNLSGGVVGLANVGKSTFFQAITRSTLGNPANFPFATIDPEEAKVVVPSSRLAQLAELYKPKSVVPASFDVVDIAGLVRGAAKGNGLGNAFLANIRAVDGLFQMVRAFDDEDVVHVENSIDSVRDAQIIHDELVLKDMEFVIKAIEATERKLKSINNQSTIGIECHEMLDACQKAMVALDAGKRVDTLSTLDSKSSIDCIRQLNLLTAKPTVFVANISEEDWCFGDPEEIVKDLKNWAAQYQPRSVVIPLSVNFESRLSKLDKKEVDAELAELGNHVSSNLPAVIIALRHMLGLQSFFTVGTDEVREWTIKTGTTAPQAASQIHEDLARTFVNAHITKFENCIASGGDEAALKRSGKIAVKGKDYVLEDGDIVQINAAGARRG